MGANAHPNRSLLPMPRAELVAQLRSPVLRDTDLHQQHAEIIHGHDHGLHTTRSPDLRRQRRVIDLARLVLGIFAH